MSETEKPEPVDTASMQDGYTRQAALADAKVETSEDSDDTETDEVEDEDTDEQNEESEDSADSDGKDAPARPKKKQGAGSRINELTREKYDAIREADALRRELETLRTPQARTDTGAKPAQAADNEGKPTLEDFDYDPDAYYTALAKWQVDAELANREQKAEQRKAQETAAERAQSFKDRESAFAAEHPDYYDVAYTAPINYSEAMLEAIRESDDAPAIAYHLAQNLDDAAEISRMSPFAAAKAIGRLEAQLSAPVERPGPPKSVTKAPAPVATLRPSAPIRKDLAELPMDDYVAERNRQRKAKGLL